jgi:hypothetical protein
MTLYTSGSSVRRFQFDIAVLYASWSILSGRDARRRTTSRMKDMVPASGAMYANPLLTKVSVPPIE